MGIVCQLLPNGVRRKITKPLILADVGGDETPQLLAPSAPHRILRRRHKSAHSLCEYTQNGDAQGWCAPNSTLTCDRASVTFWTWESPRQCTRERMHICTPRTAVLWGVCSRCGNSKINHLSFLIYQHHHSLPYVLSLPLALTLATLKFILFTTRKIA